MRGALWVLIVAGVTGVIALAVAVPQTMISPGPLTRGHAPLETDCFACHAPWQGAAGRRCARCHRLADIGIRTTRGIALAPRGLKASFHQQLMEHDCIACHRDHVGDQIGPGRSRVAFLHTSLVAAVRPLCGDCHSAPSGATHRDLTIGCTRCHRTDRWKPSDFDHSALAPIEQQHCEGCHHPPADSLHQVLQSQCQQCHIQKSWKPSTFDHDRQFVLDADHNAPCAVCHASGDIRRYSCYGCHAHRPDQIRAVHFEEGIRDFAGCVRCHRDSSEERD